MTHVTEQALEEAKQALRGEFAEQLEVIKQELSVQITEAHNRTAGITIEDVQREISAVPQPDSGLSADDVEAMIDSATDALPPPGLSAEDVQQLVTDALPAEQPIPDPVLSREEVEEMIAGIPPYDDDEIKKRILRVSVFANGLADHVGVPRMEG